MSWSSFTAENLFLAMFSFAGTITLALVVVKIWTKNTEDRIGRVEAKSQSQVSREYCQRQHDITERNLESIQEKVTKLFDLAENQLSATGELKGAVDQMEKTLQGLQIALWKDLR